MKFRDSWLATACKFVFPGGQMRAMYMSAQPPAQTDSTAEAERLINAGYPASMIAKTAAVRAMKWRVVLTPRGLFAMREDRVEHIAPGVARGLTTLSALFDTSRVKHPLPVYVHESVNPERILKLRANTGVGYLTNGGSLPQSDVDRVLRHFFGETDAGSHNVVLPLSSVVRTAEAMGVTPTTLVEWVPPRQGETALVVDGQTNYFDSTYKTRSHEVVAAVYVPELVPGLTHVVSGFSYNQSDFANTPLNNAFVHGIVAVLGSASAIAFVKKHLTRRNTVNVATTAQTFFADGSPGNVLTTVTNATDPVTDASELCPYVFNQIRGHVLRGGWIVGDCYLAAMPEFCDSFAIVGAVTRSADGKTFTFDKSVQIGATFPPDVLRALRSSSPDASSTTPAVDQRVYSWMASPSRIQPGLLGRLRLKALTDKAKVDLSKEVFIDKPEADGVPAMKVTFGEVAKRAEGQNFSFCHYMETDDIDEITHVVVTGNTAALTVTGHSGAIAKGPMDPDAVLAFMLDGGVVINQTTAAPGSPVPTLEQLVPLITGGGSLAEIQAQGTDPSGDFNLRRRFYGTWPAWPSLSSTALAAVQTYCYALDQRGLHQLLATSVAWSQIREAK